MPEDIENISVSPAKRAADALPNGPPGYELIDEIGRGGMGIVYRARDLALNRDVAVKLLSDRYRANSFLAGRFLGEARITGHLQHPGIPAIHQVGTLADGRPFLAMKLIKGNNLATILKNATDLSTKRGQFLAVFEAVCQAVGFAHAHRVIHRDIKPANVMVGAFGEVQVMDWGLAKFLDQTTPERMRPEEAEEQTRAETQIKPGPEAGSHTVAGSLIGTPAFIPPEQALGEIEKVDERSDVFGLGALLAMILTGKPPYIGETAESLRVQAVRGKLDDCFARLDDSGAEPELVALCKKCLAFEPIDRPADAGAVAVAVAELRAAADERARRAELSRAQAEVQAAEQYKRRRVLLAACGAVALVLLAGLAGSLRQMVRAINAETQATKLAGERETARQEAIAASKEATRREKLERWERYRSDLSAAFSAQQLDNLVGMSRALDSAPAEHRNWEWRHLSSKLDSSTALISNCCAYCAQTGQIAALSGSVVLVQNISPVKTLAELAHDGSPTQAWFSDDGKLLAVITMPEHRLHIWDIATRTSLASCVTPLPVNRLRFNPNGQQVYFNPENQSKWVWSFRQSQEPRTLEEHQAGEEWLIHFARTGERLLAQPGEFQGVLIDTSTMKPISNFAEAPVLVSPDGNWFAGVDAEGIVRIRDAATGELVREMAPTKQSKVPHYRWQWVWSPDGKRIAVGRGHPHNSATIWDVTTGNVHAQLIGHDNGITRIRFSSDGQRLVTAGLDRTARLWDASNGQPLAILRGHRGPVLNVEFSPDDRTILTQASSDQSLRVWDGMSGAPIAYLPGEFDFASTRFTADSALILCLSGPLRVWNLELVRRTGVFADHSSYVYDVAFSSDGVEIASAAWDGTVRVWNATTGESLKVLTTGQNDYLRSVQFSPDGEQLLTTEIGQHDSTGRTRLWNRLDGKLLETWVIQADTENFRACFDQTGSWVIAGVPDGSIRWHQAGMPLPVHVLKAHEVHPDRGSRFTETVSDVALSRDARRLVSGGYDHTVRVWSMDERKNLAVLRGHRNIISRVVFSPDDRWIASSSVDQQVIIWDAATYQEVARLGHGSAVYGIDFTSDGTRLACGCADSTIRLWDMATFQQVAELRGHSDYVHAVAFSPDGTRLVSGSGDKTVRLWDTMSNVERSRK